MPLTEYRRKRRFDRTAEPAGKRARLAKSRTKKSAWRFVIQKHAASHLHYDFRLEHEGVLKSWAVPHGPCLDPTQRRLAVEVEDHPLEYGSFEGTIPAGEYGGGTVQVWDSGTWTSDQNVTQALRAGKLKFSLEGEKLSGQWNLVRMRPRGNEKRNNWLLIKERDDEARPLSELDILEERPESALSGRTIGEIAESSDKTWTSGRAETRSQTERAKKPNAKTTSTKRRNVASGTAKARERWAKFPTAVEPQLATLVEQPPNGDDWVHEIKLDGYRILAYIDHGAVTLRTRKQNDWTRRFPELAETMTELPVKQAILDGEVVALLPDGASEFQALQGALSQRKTEKLVYFVFDLLYLDGVDLRSQPLEERKQRLLELLSDKSHARVRYSEHLEGTGQEIVEKSCRLGLEGIISKLRNGRYISGRGASWLKIKCSQRQEFVIGGFTDSTSARKGMGALLVGYFNSQGQLLYAGKVGTGFSDELQRDLRERLKTREQSRNAFENAVKDERKSTTHWVIPELVAEVKYSNWTEAGHLRQPVFQGLREDKPAREVVIERPQSSGTDRRAEKTRTREKSKPSTDAKTTNGKTPRKVSVSSGSKRSPRVTLTSSQEAELDGLKLTHPDRVLYPDLGLTKQDLVAYYAEVSEWMLPHVLNRPLSLVRCPEGEAGTCFYQKHASAGTPDALQRVMIREKGKAEPYLAIQGLSGLLSTVQMGVLEIHPWGSTLDDLDKPDRLIFDLDPDPSVPWPAVVKGAKELREQLSDLGLESFPKTSGGKGLHLVVPIQRRTGWSEAKKFCRAVAAQLAADAPNRFTAKMSKSQRYGKIFVDYLRNDRGATAVAPYSTRSRPGAPVATPLSWREVTNAIHSDHFHVGNVPARLRSLKADPWDEMAKLRQSLTQDVLKRVGVK